MATQSNLPSARRERLVVESLRDEVLVYDLDREQASCLNQTAALVYKYADGKTSVREISARMGAELDSAVDERVVWYALEQLDKRHLLEEHVTPPMEYGRLTRRDFLVKAGLVGAAVAIPVIISLAAPTAAMAVSCPNGCPCGTSDDCTGACAGFTCVAGCCATS